MILEHLYRTWRRLQRVAYSTFSLGCNDSPFCNCFAWLYGCSTGLYHPLTTIMCNSIVSGFIRYVRVIYSSLTTPCTAIVFRLDNRSFVIEKYQILYNSTTSVQIRLISIEIRYMLLYIFHQVLRQFTPYRSISGSTINGRTIHTSKLIHPSIFRRNDPNILSCLICLITMTCNHHIGLWSDILSRWYLVVSIKRYIQAKSILSNTVHPHPTLTRSHPPIGTIRTIVTIIPIVTIITIVTTPYNIDIRINNIILLKRSHIPFILLSQCKRISPVLV